MKRILVSIPEGTWGLIEKYFKGKIGEKESEIIRNIVIAYLSEKGYLKNNVKNKLHQN
ncbi:CopG family transcriptional regulator [Candidatus Woesearchaeota archaeon]|nr:CopG family transcriptional regulator [Candidatus Woesearchaeota archaeon]